MRKETVDIVNDLVNLLDYTFTIENAIDNGDGTYVLETCNTYHLQALPNCPILIDGSSYIITEVQSNEFIVVRGASLPVVTEFAVPKPFYFHGTAIKTNLELSQIDTFNKFPMVYLLEVLTDTIQNDDSSLDREADLRLFFLAPSNFQDWKTDDHYTGAILPMRSLAYNFIDILNKSTKIARFDSYTLTNRVNFGVYVTDRGNTERIFNDNMSGVEMRITLPIKKDLTCNGC
jgi:hypothetical protein